MSELDDQLDKLKEWAEHDEDILHDDGSRLIIALTDDLFNYVQDRAGNYRGSSYPYEAWSTYNIEDLVKLLHWARNGYIGQGMVDRE